VITAAGTDDRVAGLVWATQLAPAADLFNQKLDGTAWRSKPSWYIVANNDRSPTDEVDSSHVPMLSQPSFVIDVIRTAANAVSSAATRTA
jgi:hypothetical protein